MYIAQISFFERLIKSVSPNRTNQEIDKYKLPILQIKKEVLLQILMILIGK